MSFPRLSLATLDQATPALERPAYGPDLAIGNLHFGPGAFHRTHQAFLFHRLARQDRRMGVSAVSLRSPDVKQALEPQDGLYVLAQQDAEARHMAIGVLREFLVAPLEQERLLQRLVSPELRLVTSTVTEKGYCLDAAGELDFDHAQIMADLAAPDQPASLIGWLYLGLKQRRALGLAPFLTAPCDNLPDNGGRVRRAVAAYARRLDASLADWIAEAAPFASTMVDSITPATDDRLRRQVREICGLDDAWPVQREAFIQWVVERTDAPDQPDWSAAGVQLTSDVGGWEQAKLRLLNGAHSTLAYLGLLAGLETVREAVASPLLSAGLERLWTEARASLTPPEGLSLPDYCQALRRRFENPVIVHRLAQIAMDGSQKAPVRLAPGLAAAVDRGEPAELHSLAIAAWFRYFVGETRAGRSLADPLAEQLSAVARSANDDAEHDVALILAKIGVLDDLASRPLAREALVRAYADLVRRGVARAIQARL